MTKEQKFYKALQDVFVGAKIEGEAVCQFNADKSKHRN